jgi:hypothetical protein
MTVVGLASLLAKAAVKTKGLNAEPGERRD